MHPRAIKAAQALLGPNVVLMSSAVITKYPTNIKKENYKGDFVGWHQDMKYWGLTNMKPNSRIKLASMWLAIDEVYSPFMNKKFMFDEMTMRKTLEFAIFLNHVNPPLEISVLESVSSSVSFFLYFQYSILFNNIQYNSILNFYSISR